MSGARLERGEDGRLRLRGPLDFGTAAALWPEGLAAVAREGVTEIDLSAVERTDSAGVALLLDWT
ncbi:STAS domain-containing protein, partial [Halorhodospira neutriphila]